jgi:hypothetical protein
MKNTTNLFGVEYFNKMQWGVEEYPEALVEWNVKYFEDLIQLCLTPTEWIEASKIRKQRIAEAQSESSGTEVSEAGSSESTEEEKQPELLRIGGET